MSSYNEAEVNIADEPLVSKMVGNISGELNASEGKTKGQWDAFVSETGQAPSTTLGFVFSSILSALTIFRHMGTGILLAFFGLLKEVFNSPVVLVAVGTIMAIIIGLIVLTVWSVVRAGR